MLYIVQEDYEKAAPLLLDAYNGRETKLGPEHPHTVDSLRELARLYESSGKPDKAEEYRARLPQVRPGVGHDRPTLIGYNALALVGKVTYDDTNDTYTILGSGRDIWRGADQFHYAHNKLSGGGSITARVESIEHLHEWSKAGVMIRETTDAHSVFAAVFVTPGNRVCFQYRSATGEDAIGINSEANSGSLPCWVRLIREGNTFKGEHSEDGTEWKDLEGASTGAVKDTRPAIVEIDVSDPVHVGLAVCSHAGPGIPAKAKMSDVTTTGDVDPPGEFLELGGIGLKVSVLPDE